jgi:hypothetical protein
MPSRQPNTVSLAAMALLLTACATATPRATPRAEPAAECLVAGDSGLSRVESAAEPVNAAGGARHSRVSSGDATNGAAITVALTTLVDPAHAPSPRDAGERLLFAQLYEPLLRLDCTGDVVPGLAQSWSRDSSTVAGLARWSFVLRSDARFGRRERVRAADVVSSWRSSADADAHSRRPAGDLIAAIASAARAADDSTLVVAVPDSLVPLRAFASPELAVARPESDGRGWPYGTTSYYVDPTLADSARASAVRLPLVGAIGLRSTGAANPLLFQVRPDADARDILDAGTDLLITASPSAIQYARTQENRLSLPLPWSRSYALVVPALEGRESITDCSSADLRPLRDALATAVHAEARGADGPCWWETERSDATPSPTDARSHRILYPIEDPTARELAERIVALAAPGREEPATAALHRVAPELFESGGWSAAGIDSLRFAESLARGREGAYILALPRDPAWPAAARASLVAAAPWLAPLGHATSLVPLVDTRETLLIRRVRGIPRMTILHDGTVIFDSPGGDAAGSAQ